jgi:3-methylcrotonyl-CoA carboxylase alpha subunit
MFGAVLIANRGEIACRIIRTLRRFSIRAVAVYSDADRDARHVRLADEAVWIGKAAAAASYLDIDAILAAARATGAAAIHPGYGFLAEHAGFAEAVAAAGLVFIGPPPDAIRAMGEKDRAKAIAATAGLPLLPGHASAEQSPAALLDAAGALGFPVMLKAAAGGGGKGMRVVRSADAFAHALEGARREALGAFGDNRMLLERYVERPRHVEVQVFGDRHGRIVHLFERDCSLQRRHQKVIEEAPAPGLSPARRAELGAHAVRLAAAVGYVGAGTVEFLFDRDDAFYFMEMNPRLQVEHPVTELVTGLDLVEWQLRVAAGEPLPLAQDEIRLEGHAVEARLYAEDPAKGFLPATGPLRHLRLPEDAPGLRVETGVVAGDRITPHYDPMIAKLIAHGPDRASALRRLDEALAASEVVGPATNLGFLRRLLAAPVVQAGAADTGTIDADEATLAAEPVAPAWALPAAAWWWLAVAPGLARGAAAGSPWDRTDGWRLNDVACQHLQLVVDARPRQVLATGAGDGWRIEADGQGWAVGGRVLADGRLAVTIDGRSRTLRAVHERDVLHLLGPNGAARIGLADPLAEGAAGEAAEGRLTAPMPGRIIRQHVAAGDPVTAGSPLLVLEAMKMEHTIVAPADGAVTALYAGEGEQVEAGALLVEVTPAGPPPGKAA